MENKIIIILFVLIFLKCPHLFAKNVDTKKINEIEKKMNSDNFSKTYWKKRNLMPIIINDYLDKTNRIDLSGKYYHISYNKCFNVAPVIYETGDEKDEKKSNEDSAGLVFTRKKDCSDNMSYFFTNRFTILFDKEISNDEIKFEPSKVYNYRRVTISDLISLNSHRAKLVSSISDVNSVVELRLSYKIYCSGKKNEIYEIELIPDSYQEQLDFVTKHNYQLPDDIMQIISTFKCRKDR